MRTLILSCNTGAGHNSCARAIQETYQSHGEVCDIANGLQFISDHASRFICNWHVRIYRHAPRLFRSGYQSVEHHDSIFREQTAVYRFLTSGAERMYDYIRAGRYDNIICTHVFPALSLTAMRKSHDLPLLTSHVSTDYTCSPCTADSVLDYYFIPDASLTGEFLSCGVPEEKLVPSGLPAAGAFYLRPDKAAARRQLGLPEAHQHLLMMCGSMGCGPLFRLAEVLIRRLRSDQELTIVCGTNKDLYAQLNGAFSGISNLHVHQTVDYMSLLIQSADLYLTKPGGLSTTEATAAGLPMVLIDAVAGCEEYNLLYFLRRGSALTAGSPEALGETALSLLADPRRLSAMADCAGAVPSPLPAEAIYQFLRDKASKTC